MAKLGPRIPRKIKSRARELRQVSPIPERVLWGLLRNQQICGLKFRRQHVIGPLIVDFHSAPAQLVIELDGMSHVARGDKDDARTRYLERQGCRVVRITNDDLFRAPDAVVDMIARAAGFDGVEMKMKLKTKKKRREDPHPSPLPKKGEGV